MNYVGISWTSHFQNGPSSFKLFQAYYDVTTGHMTQRFEIFWKETANGQEEKRQVWSGKIHNCVESSGITACIWIQVCIGHSGVYRGHNRDVKGRSFVSYKSYLVLLKYMIGRTYIIAVTEVGQPLMVCRQEMSQLSKRCDDHKLGIDMI